MSVPRLTVPESAFDGALYRNSTRKQSLLLVYIVRLANGSALLLVLAYAVSILAIKPLLQVTAERRLEILETFRHKLRDCYLNLVGRVSTIPIVAIRKKGDASGKLYADAVVQTNSSYLKQQHGIPEDDDDDSRDKLAQKDVLFKLNQLNDALSRCLSYLVEEIPHYKTLKFAVEDFQSKADMVYFNGNELFTASVPTSAGPKKKNLVLERKNDIRSIKGMYISGQVI